MLLKFNNNNSKSVYFIFKNFRMQSKILARIFDYGQKRLYYFEYEKKIFGIADT